MKIDPTFLRDISLIWALFHVLILFVLFYKSRYSRRKTLSLTFLFMGGLFLLTSVLIFQKGALWVSNMTLLICTLPSFVFFWFMSSQRDWRFVFTFCLVDTVSLWWIALTMILNIWITPHNNLVLFWSRVIAFPASELLVFYKLRKPYQQVQQAVAKGWGSFSAVTMVFYVLLLVCSLYPTDIYSRPDGIPALILLLILMPLMYWNIFQVLLRQQRLAENEERTRILNLQSSMMEQRISELKDFEQQYAIQRHDLRHCLQTVFSMLQREEFQQAQDYISASVEAVHTLTSRRWCKNLVLDAVFSAYFRQAECEGIRIEADLDIQEKLPVDEVELSTVFANALENAIHAVKNLPPQQRVIHCKCIQYPQMMLRISNPYTGTIPFDEDGRPIAKQISHGIGTRSIAAYCEKHNAVCTYKAENGWFTIQIVITF